MDHELSENLRAQVRAAIVARCLKKGGNFKLASGKTSSVYVDCKGITLHASSLKLLSRYFWRVWQAAGESPSAIAGVSVGGDPLATGLALEALELGKETDVLLVRKEKKDHGGTQGRAVEGKSAASLNAGIVLVEDVISSGISSAKALRFLLEENYKVTSVWAILDREMGGTGALAKEFAIPVRTLFKLSDVE